MEVNRFIILFCRLNKILGEIMDIESLKGVGAKTAILLRSLGINKISDLISFYPRTYEDFSN